MNHDDIVRVLCSIRPGAEWSLSDTQIIWLDKTQSQPTDKEMNDALTALGPEQPVLSIQDQLATLKAQVTTLQQTIASM